MKWHRIKAILIRNLYLNKRSFPRMLDIFFWPIMTMFLWGFMSLYLEKTNFSGFNIIALLLGAVLLWEVLNESIHAVSIGFLEEIWEKNLLNIFVTPLKVSEFLASTVLLGLVRTAIIGIIMTILAFVAYSFNIFSLGFYLIPFVLNLLIFGWAIGFVAIAIILRYGSSAQVLAFGITFLLQPFTAVFYPVSILPKVVQYISLALPSTHVFEGMRAVIATGSISTFNLLMAFGLNIAYLTLAVLFFHKMFLRIKERGLLLKLN